VQTLVQISGHGKTYKYTILTCTSPSIGRRAGKTRLKIAVVKSNNFGDWQWIPLQDYGCKLSASRNGLKKPCIL